MSKWPEVRFGDLVTAVKTPIIPVARKEYVEIGVRSFGRGIFRKPTTTAEAIGPKKVFEVGPDLLIINIVFAWEGAVARTTSEHVGTIASHRFPTFRVDPERADLDYILFVLRSERGQGMLATASPGSAGRNRTLSTGALLDNPIPLPPLDEQRNIANWLDSVEGHARRNGTARGRNERTDLAVRESLLSLNSTSGEVAGLGDELESIRTEVVVDLESDYRTIGIKSFGRGIIRYPETKGVDMSKLRFYRFPVDSLAVSNIQAWEGALAMTSAEDAGRVASSRFYFYVKRPGGVLDPEYVLAFLRTDRGQSLVKAASPGSTMRNKTLSIRAFGDIQIPAPAPKVQERIVRALRLLDELHAQREQQSVKEKALLTYAINQVFGSLS